MAQKLHIRTPMYHPVERGETSLLKKIFVPTVTTAKVVLGIKKTF
jgi:hypothetical protein